MASSLASPGAPRRVTAVALFLAGVAAFAPAAGGERVAVYFLLFRIPAAVCGLGCGAALALRAAGATRARGC